MNKRISNELNTAIRQAEHSVKFYKKEKYVVSSINKDIYLTLWDPVGVRYGLFPNEKILMRIRKK